MSEGAETRTADELHLDVPPEDSKSLTRSQVKLKTQKRKKELVFCTLCFCVFCDACGIGFLMPVIPYMTGNQARAIEMEVLGMHAIHAARLPFAGRVSVHLILRIASAYEESTRGPAQGTAEDMEKTLLDSLEVFDVARC